MNNEVQLNIDAIKQRLMDLEMEIVIKNSQIMDLTNQIDILNAKLFDEKGGEADVENE